ncbi:hypothetical protein JCM3770_007214 [Rhodotorula araucariae]
MPGQASPAPPLDASSEQKIASLTALLAALSRTRSSLPTLLSAVSSSASGSLADRTQIYRAASAECSTAVRTLGAQLEALEDVLRAAEASEQRDSTGIVVRPLAPARVERKAFDAGKPWAELGDILAGGAESRYRKGKGREVFTPQLDPPASAQDLADFALKWQERYPRVRVQVVGGTALEPRELRVVLSGVLRASIALRWEDRHGGGGRTCDADFVICHGLMEDKPAYLPSQFTLFTSLTNDAMNIVNRCRARKAAGKAAASVEEVLAFLSAPPLPF